jgi:hypothetical protein
MILPVQSSLPDASSERRTLGPARATGIRGWRKVDQAKLRPTENIANVRNYMQTHLITDSAEQSSAAAQAA